MEKSIVLVLPVLGTVVIGYLSARFEWTGKAVTDGIHRFVFAVAVPVFVFRTMAHNDLPRDLGKVWELLASYYLGTLAVFVLAMLVARYVFQGGAADQGLFGTRASNSNLVLLGIPAVVLILGNKQAMPLLLVVGLHGVVMSVLATVVLRIQNRRTGDQLQVLLGELIVHGKNPLFLALVAGIVYGQLGLPLPKPADKVLWLLGSAALPCALFAFGGMLTRYRIGGMTREVMAVTGLKLVVHPVIVWLLAKQVFGLSSAWIWVVVMLATMPVGFDAHKMVKGASKEAGSDSATIALSTLLGAAGLTVLTYNIVAG